MIGTIFDILTQPNPHPLNLDCQKTGGLTQNSHYIRLGARDISTSTWEDFNYENIVAALGHLLEHGPVKCQVVQEDVEDSQKEIKEEDDIDRISIDWFIKVVRGPLKYGSIQTLQKLGMEENEAFFRWKGSPVKGPDSNFSPDWGIFQKSKPKSTYLVVGDSKLSSKWHSDIEEKVPPLPYEWLWPLRQIGTYSKYSGTRYAFIITPLELVVARFYMEDNIQHEYRVEFKSIPWDAHGPNVLTINLSIWALAMFAQNEGHRPIMNRSQTLPLNVWWRDENAGSLTYEHHLTGVTSSSLPPGGEARARPTGIPGYEFGVQGEGNLNGKRTRRRNSDRLDGKVPNKKQRKNIKSTRKSRA